jgi:hypothetical protein
MQIIRHPLLIIYEVFAVSAVFIITGLYVFIRFEFVQDLAFFIIYMASCFIGLFCSAILITKFQQILIGFIGIGVHLFALIMITCY